MENGPYILSPLHVRVVKAGRCGSQWVAHEDLLLTSPACSIPAALWALFLLSS